MSDNQQSGLDMAVNAFFAAHEQALEANRRNMFGIRGGQYLQSIDTKHPQCWHDYGYPTDTCFEHFYTMYKRNALGKAGINKIVDKCWQTPPWIRETDDKRAKYTAFENEFFKFANRLDLWPNMRDLDKCQRVGRYGAFLVVVADSKKRSEPISGVITPDKIKQLIPLYESQLKVNSSYQDATKPNYGLPEFYQYDENALGDSNPDSNNSEVIHESRIIPWGEGSTGNSIYGIPALEAGLNNLINIEKISGAGGEGFFKNARTPTYLEIQDGADVQSLCQVYKCKPDELAAKIEEKARKMNIGLDATWMMKGVKQVPLTVSIPNPKEFADNEKQLFAASVDVPLTILQGNQSGNQASSENGSTFDESCESRRNNEIARFIKRGFFGWLRRHNVFRNMPEDIYVCWDSLLEPTIGERLDNMEKAARIAATLMGTGMSVLTPDEIREIGGYDPAVIDIDDGEDVEVEE